MRVTCGNPPLTGYRQFREWEAWAEKHGCKSTPDFLWALPNGQMIYIETGSAQGHYEHHIVIRDDEVVHFYRRLDGTSEDLCPSYFEGEKWSVYL